MGDKSGTVAGFYIPRASASVAFIPASIGSGEEWNMDAENVLLHEYAHHFTYQNYAGAFPAWFIEGFAEFHSSAKFEKDGTVGIGMPPLHRGWGLLAGNPLPLEKMMTAEPGELNTTEREALYGRGWLLTHFLTFEPDRRDQLAAYLRGINQGESSLDAAEAAFGDLKQMSKELDRYLMRRKMSYVPIQPLPIGDLEIREVSPGEDAVMDAKIQSRRGVTRDQAVALVADMRREAAPFPDDPAVQAALAEAEYDAGNDAEAEAAADRAIAKDPKCIDALIHKAMVKMRRANGSSDPNVWDEVRRAINAANRVDPMHAVPFILFYNSFRQQGIKPTANAVAGLNEAFYLAKQDRDLRMLAAYQYLVDGKAKEARTALAPIAFDPHAGEMSKFAAPIMDQLDAGDTAAALKAWEKAGKTNAAGEEVGDQKDNAR
ncbi:tetratricopeptide repeat protein [Sphingosinicella rhizophila]|uniref:Tetratricopeptide repeat protein n=1 Tax=Sphingosinicella rhizophila TaxID=3050082 RepID=A0ABU3Q8R9_9SPHN|nr:tetratricopeptide repeat protein [Sphingosinicella sp. GR2756]MDT9599799.1 tetratricopeptide repeat protein [Sphingosinicella sp. GR2756]